VPILYIVFSLLLMSAPIALAAETETPAQTADPVTTVQPAAATDKAAFDHERFRTEVLEQKDLPNFHEVHPFLLRSGRPTEGGMQDVKAKGVTTIIDLRNPGEKKFDEAASAKQLGIKYISMPMSSAPPTKKQVDTFISVVKRAEAHPEDSKVLVHCTHGSDRTGCLVGIWRVTQDGWNYDQAYKEMRKYWFTPKFIRLSATVEQYAQRAR
jgi:protein tyrosine/serine phosphatase